MKKKSLWKQKKSWINFSIVHPQI